MKKRVIVYIDGFNFYYGLKHSPRWKQYYWLDFVRLFEQFMRPDQELVAVKYFSSRPTDVGKNQNQWALFQANKENPKFSLALGKYLRKNKRCNNCGYTIHSFEEKETDVRIALSIALDAVKDRCDLLLVVSADTDMKPALEVAREEGKEVVVLFPPNQQSFELQNLFPTQPLGQYETRFKRALLPDTVPTASDKGITIPAKWKAYQTEPENRC